MADSTKTQCATLLRELRAGPVTALQAMDRLGIARAAARVFDLRQEGWDITSQMIEVFNRHGETCRVAQYSLAKGQQTLLPVVHPGRGRLSA
ncbi:MAG: helix-turn-helix domain-containing protein [Lysobacter sp.]